MNRTISWLLSSLLSVSVVGCDAAVAPQELAERIESAELDLAEAISTAEAEVADGVVVYAEAELVRGRLRYWVALVRGGQVVELELSGAGSVLDRDGGPVEDWDVGLGLDAEMVAEATITVTEAVAIAEQTSDGVAHELGVAGGHYEVSVIVGSRVRELVIDSETGEVLGQSDGRFD